MKTINIYSGESLTNSPGGLKLHPYTQVVEAIAILEDEDEKCDVYTNSPDFISAVVHIGNAKGGVEVNLFLNGNPSNIEEVFNDFNRSYELIGQQIEKYENESQG